MTFFSERRPVFLNTPGEHPVPETTEAQKGILGEFPKLEEFCRNMLRTLEDIARTFFSSGFTHVGGTMTPRFRESYGRLRDRTRSHQRDVARHLLNVEGLRNLLADLTDDLDSLNALDFPETVPHLPGETQPSERPSAPPAVTPNPSRPGAEPALPEAAPAKAVLTLFSKPPYKVDTQIWVKMEPADEALVVLFNKKRFVVAAGGESDRDGIRIQALPGSTWILTPSVAGAMELQTYTGGSKLNLTVEGEPEKPKKKLELFIPGANQFVGMPIAFTAEPNEEQVVITVGGKTCTVDGSGKVIKGDGANVTVSRGLGKLLVTSKVAGPMKVTFADGSGEVTVEVKEAVSEADLQKEFDAKLKELKDADTAQKRGLAMNDLNILVRKYLTDHAAAKAAIVKYFSTRLPAQCTVHEDARVTFSVQGVCEDAVKELNDPAEAASYASIVGLLNRDVGQAIGQKAVTGAAVAAYLRKHLKNPLCTINDDGTVTFEKKEAVPERPNKKLTQSFPLLTPYVGREVQFAVEPKDESVVLTIRDVTCTVDKDGRVTGDTSNVTVRRTEGKLFVTSKVVGHLKLTFADKSGELVVLVAEVPAPDAPTVPDLAVGKPAQIGFAEGGTLKVTVQAKDYVITPGNPPVVDPDTDLPFSVAAGDDKSITFTPTTAKEYSFTAVRAGKNSRAVKKEAKEVTDANAWLTKLTDTWQTAPDVGHPKEQKDIAFRKSGDTVYALQSALGVVLKLKAPDYAVDGERVDGKAWFNLLVPGWSTKLTKEGVWVPITDLGLDLNAPHMKAVAGADLPVTKFRFLKKGAKYYFRGYPKEDSVFELLDDERSDPLEKKDADALETALEVPGDKTLLNILENMSLPDGVTAKVNGTTVRLSYMSKSADIDCTESVKTNRVTAVSAIEAGIRSLMVTAPGTPDRVGDLPAKNFTLGTDFTVNADSVDIGRKSYKYINRSRAKPDIENLFLKNLRNAFKDGTLERNNPQLQTWFILALGPRPEQLDRSLLNINIHFDAASQKLFVLLVDGTSARGVIEVDWKNNTVHTVTLFTYNDSVADRRVGFPLDASPLAGAFMCKKRVQAFRKEVASTLGDTVKEVNATTLSSSTSPSFLVVTLKDGTQIAFSLSHSPDTSRRADVVLGCKEALVGTEKKEHFEFPLRKPVTAADIKTLVEGYVKDKKFDTVPAPTTIEFSPAPYTVGIAIDATISPENAILVMQFGEKVLTITAAGDVAGSAKDMIELVSRKKGEIVFKPKNAGAIDVWISTERERKTTINVAEKAPEKTLNIPEKLTVGKESTITISPDSELNLSYQVGRPPKTYTATVTGRGVRSLLSGEEPDAFSVTSNTPGVLKFTPKMPGVFTFTSGALSQKRTIQESPDVLVPMLDATEKLIADSGFVVETPSVSSVSCDIWTSAGLLEAHGLSKAAALALKDKLRYIYLTLDAGHVVSNPRIEMSEGATMHESVKTLVANMNGKKPTKASLKEFSEKLAKQLNETMVTKESAKKYELLAATKAVVGETGFVSNESNLTETHCEVWTNPDLLQGHGLSKEAYFALKLRSKLKYIIFTLDGSQKVTNPRIEMGEGFTAPPSLQRLVTEMNGTTLTKESLKQFVKQCAAEADKSVVNDEDRNKKKLHETLTATTEETGFTQDETSLTPRSCNLWTNPELLLLNGLSRAAFLDLKQSMLFIVLPVEASLKVGEPRIVMKDRMAEAPDNIQKLVKSLGGKTLTNASLKTFREELVKALNATYAK